LVVCGDNPPIKIFRLGKNYEATESSIYNYGEILYEFFKNLFWQMGVRMKFFALGNWTRGKKYFILDFSIKMKFRILIGS
jgi:hypothetical protein